MANFNLNDYVTVNERLEAFRRDHPTWVLNSEIVHDDGQRIVMRAWIVDPETQLVVATGHAEEVRGQGMINKTSAVENCETSAWGRALANLGFYVSKSIASRQEMEKSQRGQDALSPVEGLKADLNRIAPPERRAAVKKAFAEKFGHPDQLSPDKLDEANAFVRKSL